MIYGADIIWNDVIRANNVGADNVRSSIIHACIDGGVVVSDDISDDISSDFSSNFSSICNKRIINLI